LSPNPGAEPRPAVLAIRSRFDPATIAAVLLIIVIAGRRWWQMGPYPTGLDGGQWLALGRGLFSEGRSSAGAYPPLVPFLTHLLRSLTEPSTALKLMAVSSLVTVLIAIYLVARDGLGPWLGLAALATVGQASVLTEPTAFGGYPQHLAFAGLLLASWGVAHTLESGRGSWFLVATAGLTGAALAHHVYYPLTLGTCGLAWLLWLATRPFPGLIWRRSGLLLAAIAISALAFVPTAIGFVRNGYAPPLDASGLNSWAAFQYGTREAAWLWLLIAIAGAVSLAVTAPSRHRDPVWQVAVALVAGSGAIFAVTGEVRLLPPVLTGAVLGLGYGWLWLVDRIRSQRGRNLPLVGVFLLPALLWLPADTEATRYAEFYRTLDQPLLGAAAAIEAASPDGIVAVRQDRRGWPIGWWLEGLTTARIAVGSDPRWLGFPAEREQAALVDRFFGQRLDSDQLRALAAETGVEVLALRKWEWIGWQRWLEEPRPPVEVVYDDDDLLVLRVIPE
jgi:hypothetical protein